MNVGSLGKPKIDACSDWSPSRSVDPSSLQGHRQNGEVKWRRDLFVSNYAVDKAYIYNKTLASILLEFDI